jgi:hypothetical protein
MADPVYSQFVDPAEVRLELPHGQWIAVRKELNAGEHRRMLLRMMKPAPVPMNGRDAALLVDQTMATLSAILAYLLDWSFVDATGRPVVIRGASIEDKTAALEALKLVHFQEVSTAIQAHQEAVDRAVEAAKADPFAAIDSFPISRSVA